MPLRNLVHTPRVRRALIVALALAACTDRDLPTAATASSRAQSLAPVRPSLDAIAATSTASPALGVSPASVTIVQGRGIMLGAINVDPLNAMQAKARINWSSSDPAVATVSSTGKVLGVAPGTATITASANDRRYVATSAVTVVARQNCDRRTPLPTNITGVLAPIPPGYEDTPLIFRMDVGDPEFCHKYNFRVVDVPVSGVLYQVADDGTPRLDTPIGNGMTVSNNQGWVAYVSNPNFFGADSFRYNVTDQEGRFYGFFTPVPIYILPVNDPPTAIPSTHVGDNDIQVANVQLLARDVDALTTDECITELPLNGDLYWSAVSPANRVVKGDCRPLRSLRYVSRIDGNYGCGALPARSSFPHTDSFRWYASDGRSISDTVTGTIRVDYVNLPPEYSGVTSASTSEGTQVTFALSGSDPDGNAFAFQVNALPRHGTLWLVDPGSAPTQIDYAPALFLPGSDGTRSLQYIPDPTFNTVTQTDDFHFQLTDGSLRNCDYMVRFDVAPVNDAPTISAPAFLTAFVGQPTGVFGIAVSDDARPTDVLTITLRAQGAAAGRIDIVDPTGLTIRRVSATEIAYDGTLAAIKTLLDRGVQWTPNGSGANFGELAIIVDDRGNFGAGGPRVGTKIVPVDVGTDGEGGLESLPVGAVPRAPVITRRPATPDLR